MKIAINCLNLKILEPVGPDIYLINLIKALAKIDQINEYTLIFSTSETNILKNLELSSENFKIVQLSNAFSTTHTNLAYHLFKNKYDVFFNSYHTIPIFRPKKTKFVSMIHGLEFETNFLSNRPFLKGFFEWLTLVFSDKIIVPSKYVKKRIEYKNWPLVYIQKIFVVPEGVSEDFYKKTFDEINAVKKTFKINGDYLFFVSTIQPRKNIPTLVEAFAHIVKNNEEFSNLKLVISGKKGWEFEESLEAPNKFGVKDNVIFTGRITKEELICLYSGSKAYVNFSIDEGFGLPLLEAFKCQTICVVSDIPAFRETGLALPIYADPYNYFDIAQKILIALKMTDVEQIAKHAKQLEQTQNFTWENTAKNTLTIIENSVKCL